MVGYNYLKIKSLLKKKIKLCYFLNTPFTHIGKTGMGDLPQPQSQRLKPRSPQLSTAVHRGLPQARLPAMALSCATWAPLAFPAASLGDHMHAHVQRSSPASCHPQHPSWADLGCIKESSTISTQAKWAGHRQGKEQMSWSASYSIVKLPHWCFPETYRPLDSAT